MNKSNMSWEQAFAECNASSAKHERKMKLTNELFPKEDGTLWVNWIGLSENDRNVVYEAL